MSVGVLLIVGGVLVLVWAILIYRIRRALKRLERDSDVYRTTHGRTFEPEPRYHDRDRLP